MTALGPDRIHVPEGASQAVVDAMVDDLRGHGDHPHLTTWFAEPAQGERRILVDQTNVSVVVGERAVVKWLNQPISGRQPAPERLQLLAQAGYPYTPRPWGLVHDETGALLAIVTAFVPGAVDGWEWGPAMVRALARGEIALHQALQPLDRIGAVVAGMHAVFSTAGVGLASGDQVEGWYATAVDALGAAQRGMAALVGELSDEAVLLRALSEAAQTQLSALRGAAGTPLILIHGDLHLGQVLRTPTPAGSDAEFMLIDFDGSPVLDMEQRLAPQPAAVDVAGMLCSIDHVGRVVLHRTPE
ncbi:MAG: phosphotransferase, partial [Actinomycetales bacterium]